MTGLFMNWDTSWMLKMDSELLKQVTYTLIGQYIDEDAEDDPAILNPWINQKTRPA